MTLPATRLHLADAVRAQARRTPHATAIEHGTRIVDYSALDAAGDRVALRLRAAGIGAGQTVAVALPRSWQLICVMLGIRRNGCTVVPLDRLSPPDRRRHILNDSGSVAVVHDGSGDLGLSSHLAELAADELLAPVSVLERTPATAGEEAGATAGFLFYTSGTTGRPKGVEVTDEGVLRLARPGYLRLDSRARYACLANPAFDALSFEVWVPLLTGGTCVVLDDTVVHDAARLAAFLREYAIDSLFITVALFNTVVDQVPDCFAAVREVLVGGERVDAAVIRRWYKANPAAETVLHNVYGPTEATTFALCHPIPRNFAGDDVPIGRPLPGTRYAVITEDGTPALTDEAGELLLAGEALALGYRNLPEETDHRFTVPAGTDTRWYRTGDLVRANKQGLVSYVGRADRQVKVRGFRIEPGEVEHALLAHAAIRRAYVCAQRDDAGRNELLAFLVLADDLSHDIYDRHLGDTLPSYMRPHHAYLVGELPLTANGKVDAARLLSERGSPWRGQPGEQTPVTEAQRAVLNIAEEVLGVSGLRPKDRWIPSGGDSLAALRFRFALMKRHSCDLPLDLVVSADFDAMAHAMQLGSTSATAHPPVRTAPSISTGPASSEQQRLWLLHQRDPADRSYDVPLAFHVMGAVDLAALRHALRTVVERHPALRTCLLATPQGLTQQVGDPYDPWQRVDEPLDDAWQTAVGPFFAAPFDLTDPRMLRAGWLPRPDGGILLLHLHHIAVDGWSLNLLFRDLSTAYASATTGTADVSPTPVVTTLDFARWQNDWRQSPAYGPLRTQLTNHYREGAGPSPTLVAADRGSNDGPRLLHTTIGRLPSSKLDTFAAQHGITRFPLLLSAFACALYGATGQSRPLIAAPVAGRPRPEFADTVGMFANTVLLPLHTTPRRGLREQLQDHATTVRTVLDGQEVVLADVVEDHAFRSGGGPLFDFLFVLENTEFDALRLPGTALRPLWTDPLGAKCALTLSVVAHEAGFDCLWEYDAARLSAARVDAVARLFHTALDRLTHTSDSTVADLIASWRPEATAIAQGTQTAPEFTTVAQGFARQVQRTPDLRAVTDGTTTLTYADLDGYAAALADDIARRHPLPDDEAAPAAVAVYLEPSVEHIVALLACARLNVTVVPVDPAYPPTLLRHVLNQVDPLCVLHAPDTANAVDAIAPAALVRHPLTLAGLPQAGSARRPHRGARPLYTLFTSGSTGVPKGVQVSERTLCNLITWQQDAGPAGPAVTQQFSMLSFDVSFQEIFTTLCTGGLLRLIEPGWRRDLPTLLNQLESHAVERLFLPYVALQLLAEHGVRTGLYPSRLRDVITAGEQLICTNAIRRWFAGMNGARLFNHYGPTETHVVSGLCLEGDPAQWPQRPAIGRPVSHAVLHVVDEETHPVPPGVTGQLLIGGPMAVPCYLGDPAHNRSRFLPDPRGGTLYRTGDLARFDADGLLHYVGREDTQIKFSGHRLELGQVEAAILEYPDVVNAVVVLEGGQLTACLECRGPDPALTDLDRHLDERLPHYVRIGRVRRLAVLPRTPSGKLDRDAALTAVGTDLEHPGTPERSLTPLEDRLTQLFADVTGKRPGPDQRYFDAGATSLDLMRFHLRCNAEPDLIFRMTDLFEHVSLRALAQFLTAHVPAGAAAKVPTTSQASPPGGSPESAPATAPQQAAQTPSPGPATIRAATERSSQTQHTGAVHSATEPIAVVGMAVRLPGAPDLAAFWDMIVSGRRGIEHFPAADGQVGARSQPDGLMAFDPARFTISPVEARLMDPQQRLLLMVCVEALAHAGIADASARSVGLIAACGENTYFQRLLRQADPADLPDEFRLALHHEKDFLATKAAYHLGLTGPALNVQTACSSSLVGVHLATQMLRQGDADVMLVGGVLVDQELSAGYTYRPQHIFSPDGHCRSFSADAAGTVGGSGASVVVLKPLRLARRDGDTVYAILTGSAVNNDGARKLGYSAPSQAGQHAAIRTALRRSGRRAADLGYVEAHGTGTRLGDPVEARALQEAYDPPSGHPITLSSVKSQIGHLGAAAGVTGLVRAVLAVHHGTIPPTADFDRLNPEIDSAAFRVPVKAETWPQEQPRVAAVSSFGIGGTNAHVLLENGPDERSTAAAPLPCAAPLPVLALSGHSASALRADAGRIADYLTAHPDRYEQVVGHLRTGRPALRHRAATECPDVDSAVAWLRALVPVGVEVPALSRVTADALDAERLADAWTAGHDVDWQEPSLPAPWDFPPPAFDLADYEFRTSVASGVGGGQEGVRRLPPSQWLHQNQWARWRRARTRGDHAPGRIVVIVSDDASTFTAWDDLVGDGSRVVHVQASASFARLDVDHYRADPTCVAHLAAVLADVTAEPQTGIDWVHALPLAVSGTVDESTTNTAVWACLDTVAALCAAVADLPTGSRPALWLLTHGAQPVNGSVVRPELALAAAATEVPRQELGLTVRWVDMPDPEPAGWASRLSALFAETMLPATKLALRDGHWWYPERRPVSENLPEPGRLPEDRAGFRPPAGTHLILGGTGGIGTTLATRILQESGTRVVLLARHVRLPAPLATWTDRVTLVSADLAEESPESVARRLAPHMDGLVGVVHAVGTAQGTLLARRDRGTARQGIAAKLHGALLAESVLRTHQPRYVLYCSSMSAEFGGIGQFDYAAANALLDGFAHHTNGDVDTVRTSIAWDAWRDVGMAHTARVHDARHRAHLKVALTQAEATRVLDRVMDLQLPHVLVSTTSLVDSAGFYEPLPDGGGAAEPSHFAEVESNAVSAAADPAAQLLEATRALLGVDALDPTVSLYDLGADSLTLLELLSEVQRLYGTDLDLARLSHRVTFTEVLDHVMAPASSPAPAHAVDVEVWQHGAGPDVLCLVHPVGGDIQAYRALVSALPAHLTVCLIADPALRAPDGPAWSLTERAEHYLAAARAQFPAARYRLRLAGWSFGAWTALSMAALAENSDEPVESLYLLDPPSPGSHAGFDFDEQQVAAVFAHELRGSQMDEELTETGRHYAERLARCCRANLAAMAGHELPTLKGTTSAVWLADRLVAELPTGLAAPSTAEEWTEILPVPAHIYSVSATHYELVAKPYVLHIASIMAADVPACADSPAPSADARNNTPPSG
ncbi:amino acid adenylation domain-containing protein [Streptomyces sp. NPDC026665]|uniref:amino acid adenylation domain-containing protein n=1 Tax=Streptomyces sp. NPDC026665 TaxID=3154798 RepID=UPI0033D93135